MVLTDTALRNAKPGEKPYKLYVEKGLFVIVNPTGKLSYQSSNNSQSSTVTLLQIFIAGYMICLVHFIQPFIQCVTFIF